MWSHTCSTGRLRFVRIVQFARCHHLRVPRCPVGRHRHRAIRVRGGRAGARLGHAPAAPDHRAASDPAHLHRDGKGLRRACSGGGGATSHGAPCRRWVIECDAARSAQDTFASDGFRPGAWRRGRRRPRSINTTWMLTPCQSTATTEASTKVAWKESVDSASHSPTEGRPSGSDRGQGWPGRSQRRVAGGEVAREVDGDHGRDPPTSTAVRVDQPRISSPGGSAGR